MTGEGGRDRAGSGTQERSDLSGQLEEELFTILADASISTAFQPIVELLGGAVVAYEGLSRGPSGSRLRQPADLFEVARTTSRLADLDWACRLTALQRALVADIRPPLTLFLNIEPQVLTAPPETAGPVLARAMGGLRVVVELTERALLAQPSELLEFVETIRHFGWGIAVDDVGAHPHSLAMLSVIEPDVVKLDLPELKQMASATSSALVSGVQTYCRRSNAVVVAEGLETQEDVETSRSLGARYGQGFFFGRPLPLVKAPAAAGGPMPLINARAHRPARRLIHALTREEPPQLGDRARIEGVSLRLLEHAQHLGPNTMVLVGVQNQAFLSVELQATLAALVPGVAYLSVVGRGVAQEPVPGAHGGPLPVGDPLVSEWVVALVGLQEAIALVASDLGDDYDAGSARRYEYIVSYNPTLVTDVARALMSRLHSDPLV